MIFSGPRSSAKRNMSSVIASPVDAVAVSRAAPGSEAVPDAHGQELSLVVAHLVAREEPPAVPKKLLKAGTSSRWKFEP